MNAYPRQFRMFKMKTKKQLGDRKYGAMSPAVYFFYCNHKIKTNTNGWNSNFRAFHGVQYRHALLRVIRIIRYM